MSVIDIADKTTLDSLVEKIYVSSSISDSLCKNLCTEEIEVGNEFVWFDQIPTMQYDGTMAIYVGFRNPSETNVNVNIIVTNNKTYTTGILNHTASISAGSVNTSSSSNEFKVRKKDKLYVGIKCTTADQTVTVHSVYPRYKTANITKTMPIIKSINKSSCTVPCTDSSNYTEVVIPFSINTEKCLVIHSPFFTHSFSRKSQGGNLCIKLSPVKDMILSINPSLSTSSLVCQWQIIEFW